MGSARCNADTPRGSCARCKRVGWCDGGYCYQHRRMFVSKKQRHPKTVFISWINHGTSDEFREIYETAQDAANVGEDREVAEYQLVKVHRVKTKIVVE